MLLQFMDAAHFVLEIINREPVAQVMEPKPRERASI
jgi:hypothetical protein